MAKLPAGTRIQTSIANSDKEFGVGGAMQIELLRKPQRKLFAEPQPIDK
jgi:hypothetical protein